jgi:atypical dual specificity phosphatase
MMNPPYGFYWVEPGRIAGLAKPQSLDDLAWLRANGIQLVITLLPEPLPKRWIDDAGLMADMVPIPDFDPPTPDQFESIIRRMRKAADTGLGVAVHCQVGRGRTGTVLAGWLVSQGMSADTAIETIRRLRPGSIETMRQERAVHEFAASRRQ